MKSLSLSLSAFLLTSLFQSGAVAQSAVAAAVTSTGVPKESAQKLVTITPELRRDLLLKYKAWRSILFTDPIDCTFDGDVCRIMIQLVELQDSSGNKFCVGLLPEEVKLKGTASSNPTKRIVWNIIPPSPTVPDAEFFFYSENDHGVTWLSNITSSGGQNQLHTGRLGDGSLGSPDRMKWVVKNRHRATGTAVYLPIVLQKDTTTGKIALCGTPDPRIVNEN